MKDKPNILFAIPNVSMKTVLMLFIFGIISGYIHGQGDKEKLKDLRESQELISDAGLALQKDEFPIAEAEYRKAIALNPTNETGKYNLGTAYYGKSKNAEAMRRFKQAASVATVKADKHKAFHNLGNTFMNEKKYAEAVEAYKNALRNKPTDDETRYNLALAKDMLEKNPPQDDKGDDENEDKKDNKDKKEEGENKEGDDGDKKEDKDKGDKKDENKEGDDEKDKGKPEEPKDGEEDKPEQQQPVPGQLSPQQVKSLLEAMNNEEKKVQDKINAQKQKGAKIKSNKDW